MKFYLVRILIVLVILEKVLVEEGIKFHLNSSVTDIKLKNNFDLYYKNLKTGKDTNNHFEKILVAIGIQGNINNLGLENTAIKIKNNQIITYEYGKTDEKNFAMETSQEDLG